MLKVFTAGFHEPNTNPLFLGIGMGCYGLGMRGISFETTYSTNLEKTQAERTIYFMHTCKS